MNSAVILAFVMALYAVAYRLYGKFMQRHFEVDASRRTPAHTERDDIDFVPAKNWWVLFGHHFSSICGAGPIVGPVLACAYWGWGVSLIWILIGAVFMGAVSDFSALMMSVRSRGESISQVSGHEISPKVKLYFSIFLWISLILVIAVFSIFAAKTFIEEPDAVAPSVGLIPVALLTGWLFYRTRIANWQVTFLGLGLLAGLLALGRHWQFVMPELGGVNAETSWIIVLLAYCYVASVIPVQVLLQPRDFLASFILFSMILIGVVSVFVTAPVLEGDAFTLFLPADWPKAGPLWPMLFVTIACGAISGFHAVVSSGTTCKQIDTETHACRIGYGGMLLESLVAVLVLICVTAGLKQTQLGAILRDGGPIAAFGRGFGTVSEKFLGGYGRGFAILALNAFILTTLDTATRITRYMTTELFGIKSKHAAALIVVTASALLAFSGKWGLLWPAFGASNQLIAGITLLIAGCWMLKRGKSGKFFLAPAFFMLMTTLAAFTLQLGGALLRKSAEGAWNPDILMGAVDGVLIFVAVSILSEAFRAVKKHSCPV